MRMSKESKEKAETCARRCEMRPAQLILSEINDNGRLETIAFDKECRGTSMYPIPVGLDSFAALVHPAGASVAIWRESIWFGKSWGLTSGLRGFMLCSKRFLAFLGGRRRLLD